VVSAVAVVAASEAPIVAVVGVSVVPVVAQAASNVDTATTVAKRTTRGTASYSIWVRLQGQ
jgi:hypothetical protein